MNFRFIAADTLQKIIVLTVLAIWSRTSSRGSLEWSITLFSLSTLPNTLVMGIPLLKGIGARIIIAEQFPDTTPMPSTSAKTRLILIMVCRKLIRNPNTYSSLIGFTWSLVLYRFCAGITKVPQIFFTPRNSFHKASDTNKVEFSIPVLDLGGIETNQDHRKETVNKVGNASSTWGFFQVVNHGIELSVLDEMLKVVRRFYEEDTQVKKEWYTRDGSKRVVYNSNFDLYNAASGNWRDTNYCSMAPKTPNPEELPHAC
ncbi:hypothetical protein RD792_005455, partial [Penstemon davidsonii]